MNSAPTSTFVAPPLPTVLTHLSTIGPFVHAQQPDQIATEWTAAREVMTAYGIESCASFPQGDGAHAFRKGVIEELQVPLSRAIIARAGEMDVAKLNGHKRIIDSIGEFVAVGLVTPHASDVLVESAALAFGLNGREDITSLADLLTAATEYVTGTDEPRDKVMKTLANAFGHHGVTIATLKRGVIKNKRAEALPRAPHVSAELENRLFRMVANVKRVSLLEERYGMTEMHIARALEAGIISRPAGEGILNVWRQREDLYARQHFWYGINRGIACTSIGSAAVSLALLLDNVQRIGPGEAKTLGLATLTLLGIASFTGLFWFLSPVRKNR